MERKTVKGDVDTFGGIDMVNLARAISLTSTLQLEIFFQLTEETGQLVDKRLWFRDFVYQKYYF